MEKTQTDPQRAQRRNDRELVSRAGAGAPLALSYLTPGEFEIHQASHKGRMIRAVAFGAQRPRITAPDCPYAWVDMPVLNDESVFEVWTCTQPVVREDADGLERYVRFNVGRHEAFAAGSRGSCIQTDPRPRIDTGSVHRYHP